MNAMLSRSRLGLASALAAAVLALAACGGDDKPTSVSAADLDKTGELWVVLTPDLKRELIDDAKVRLGEERPDGADEIRAIREQELIDRIDDEYANETNRRQTIYETYTFATEDAARENFNEIAPQLDDALTP